MPIPSQATAKPDSVLITRKAMEPHSRMRAKSSDGRIRTAAMVKWSPSGTTPELITAMTTMAAMMADGVGSSVSAR